MNQCLKIDWIVQAQQDGMLLRDFLRVEKKMSKKALAEVKFNGGTLLVNGEEVTVRKRLSQQDKVTVCFPPEKRSESLIPQKLELDILFEDDHYLLINKPAGLPTIPSREHPSYTLANGVLAYFAEHNIPGTFHAVNRLDRDTSGIVIIAKHSYAHDLLAKEQKQGNVERTYVAIVHGKLKEQKGTIAAPIGRKSTSIIEREVREDGQEAITHYEVIQATEEETTVSIKLETGRTHQIRVHFSSIGHPLLGDDLYGGKKEKINRQALHSRKASFSHPFSEKYDTFTAPIPEDMRALVERKERRKS